MTRKETVFRFLEVVFAGLAFAVSLFALWFSISSTKQSNEIAAQALAISKQANDIAVGRTREYPLTEIGEVRSKGSAFTSVDAAKNAEILLTIKNRGNVPISGVQLLVIGLSGLTYSLEDATEQYRDLSSLRYTIAFDEQLTPNGIAHLDIKVPILKYLHNLNPPFAHPNVVHRSVFNVVVLSKRAGEDLPIQTPGLPVKDREIITVEYIPAIIHSQEFGSFLESQKPMYSVFASLE